MTDVFFAILVFLLLEVWCGSVHEPGHAEETAAMRTYGAGHHAKVQDLPVRVHISPGARFESNGSPRASPRLESKRRQTCHMLK